jgi:hypothetical protein
MTNADATADLVADAATAADAMTSQGRRSSTATALAGMLQKCGIVNGRRGIQQQAKKKHEQKQSECGDFTDYVSDRRVQRYHRKSGKRAEGGGEVRSETASPKKRTECLVTDGQLDDCLVLFNAVTYRIRFQQQQQPSGRCYTEAANSAPNDTDADAGVMESHVPNALSDFVCTWKPEAARDSPRPRQLGERPADTSHARRGAGRAAA